MRGGSRTAAGISTALAAGIAARQVLRLLQLNRTLRSMSLGPDAERRVQHAVIPCFGESDTAPDTAMFFRQQHPDVEVTFVTAASEDQQATASALRGVGAETVIVSGADCCKAGLVNAFAGTANQPFVIYDADSAPTAVPVQPVNKTEVVQQLSVYSPPPGAAQFWRGVGMNQTRWGFSFEASNSRKRHGWYVVGHGLAMWPELLRDEPFMTGIHGDDLELGYRLSYLGAHVRLDYSSVDRCGIPTRVDEFVDQASRWFIGDVTGIRKAIQRHGLRPRLVLRAFGPVCWWLRPPGLAVLSVAALRGKDRKVLLALVCAGLAEATSFLRLNGWLSANGLSAARIPSGFAGFLAKPVLSSWGAFRAVWRYRLGTAPNGPAKARPNNTHQQESG